MGPPAAAPAERLGRGCGSGGRTHRSSQRGPSRPGTVTASARQPRGTSSRPSHPQPQPGRRHGAPTTHRRPSRVLPSVPPPPRFHRTEYGVTGGEKPASASGAPPFSLPAPNVDKLFFKDGSYYEGKFVNGETMGNGFQYWASGEPVTITYPLKKRKKGQWRNDVFNERGAIVNCSGDICDGLWINGFPADCRSFGRNHDVAGISEQPMKRTTSSSSAIGFPLFNAADQNREFCCLFENSGFALADLPVPKGEEPESGSDTLYGAGVLQAASVKGGIKPSGRISAEKAEKMTVSQEKMEDSRKNSLHVTEFHCVTEILVNSDCIFFFILCFNTCYYKFFPVTSPCLCTETVLFGGSFALFFPHLKCLIPNFPLSFSGQYVLMVHEVTMPQLLGQTPTPAFKLLNFSRETKTKNKDSFKVTSK
ncbi:LOW QUALITY PROTEIN: MORN repeat-containing protein 1 [Alca torda]